LQKVRQKVKWSGQIPVGVVGPQNLASCPRLVKQNRFSGTILYVCEIKLDTLGASKYSTAYFRFSYLICGKVTGS